MSTTTTSLALSSTVSGTVSHGDPGDLRDDVRRALQVLDIEGGPHVDAGGEHLLDVLVALRMAAVGGVGGGEFVNDDELRLARQRRVDVEFLEHVPAIFDSVARQDFVALDQSGRFLPPVALGEADDDIDALQLQGAGLGEHGEGLGDAGRRAEEDLELAAPLLADGKSRWQEVHPDRAVCRDGCRWGTWARCCAGFR